tara:strand:- start:3775 stop:3981 length:207 start_codon:yes stop_codon:yes gene_type:complete
MNKYIQNIRNRIQYYKAPETYYLNENIDCDVTEEIERALWKLKDDLDLPTEEIKMAVDSRKKLKGEKK